MANISGQPAEEALPLLPLRLLPHGMQGLSPASASRLLAAISALKDHPGAYDFGEVEQPLGFNLGKERFSSERNSAPLSKVAPNVTVTGLVESDNTSKRPILQAASPSVSTSADSQPLPPYPQLYKGNHPSFDTPSNQRLDVWGEPHMADNSPRTDTSTIEPDGKTEFRVSEGLRNGVPRSTKSADGLLAKNGDSKAQRRLAQNREAARKSRLRKKAYVQQLENSRLKLNQMEQELQRARQQGFFVGGSFSADQNHIVGSNVTSGAMNAGAIAFDMEYVRWLEELSRQTNELRAVVHNHTGDNDLSTLVDSVMAHYDELYRLKSIAVKADVFHLLSGMWKTPAERCFLWMGGYRPSELLKIIIPQVEPLTEQQVLGICNLQQSSQQAEDALSQGMDSLQQSLAETLSTGSLALSGGPSGNVANYMGQMAMAMGKLGTFESFVRQADLLRQQTFQQLQRVLTTRQSARALLVVNDYFSRLRALSSLWLARPRES